MADILLGNEAARKLSKIFMRDNTVKRRIEDMSNDILSQIVHGIKKSDFPIALQLDESTGVACVSQLLVYVRYVQKAGTKLELKEEFLFCESLQTTATASDVMNLIKAFFGKHDIPLEKIGFACTDGALAMLGCKLGFVTLLKEMNSNLVIIHCILHRYALMSKTLPDNLKEVMDSAVHMLLLLLITRPLPRDGDMAEDYGAPEAGQLPRVWTRGRKGTESRQRVSGAKSP